MFASVCPIYCMHYFFTPRCRGEICVRGRNVMMGYKGMPEKTASAIDGEGWLRSGDLVSKRAIRSGPTQLPCRSGWLVGWLVVGSLVSKDGRSDISRILMPSPYYPTAGLCPKTLHLDLAIPPPSLRGIQSRSCQQQSVFGSTNAIN